MDAPVIAAIITATATPILSGVAAWLGGGRATLQVARENRQWDNINKSIADLHGDNVKLADDAQAHLADLVRHEKLNPTQRAWVRSSLQTFIAAKRRGSVGGS